MDMITFAMLNSLKKSGGAGYTRKQKTYIFPEQTVEFAEGEGGMGGIVLEPALNLVVGNEYTVLWDGVEYKLVAHLNENTEPHVIQLGNDALSNGENNTGEPFLFAKTEFGDILMTNNLDTHIVAVYEETETIHPIDPKFLPGVCLPVVELEAVPTVEGVILTEAETTLVKRLLETNDYALVSFIDNETGFPVNTVCRKMTNEDGVGYFGIIGGAIALVVLVAQDGTGMALGGAMS